MTKTRTKTTPRLIYIKHPCVAEDAYPRFFLHLFLADESALPADRREHGFDNLDFNKYASVVKISGDRCVAIRGLRGYTYTDIRRILTGQFTHAGRLWQADISLNE